MSNKWEVLTDCDNYMLGKEKSKQVKDGQMSDKEKSLSRPKGSNIWQREILDE